MSQENYKSIDFPAHGQVVYPENTLGLNSNVSVSSNRIQIQPSFSRLNLLQVQNHSYNSGSDHTNNAHSAGAVIARTRKLHKQARESKWFQYYQMIYFFLSNIFIIPYRCQWDRDLNQFTVTTPTYQKVFKQHMSTSNPSTIFDTGIV